MRLPDSAVEAHPWVVTRIANDFELLDVWGLPAEGRRDEFGELVELITSFDPAAIESPIVRALFDVRLRVGGWLGWDDDAARRPIPGCTETTLKARLPAELRDTAGPPPGGALAATAGGFDPLYRTEDEWAAEISNATVHGVLHLAWAEGDDDRYRGQLAVFVKPRGLLGAAYLRVIDPFRHLLVYPALMRQIGRAWAERSRA